MNRLYDLHEDNINNFANAVEDTRNEGTSVSIVDIAKCFKAQFDEAEIESLIRELKNNKTDYSEMFENFMGNPMDKIDKLKIR